MNNQQNKLYWVYLIGFFLILCLPLVSLAPWFHPPAWAKAIIFRIIFSILLFLFIYQILIGNKNNLFLATIKNKIFETSQGKFWSFWALIVVLGIFSLATILSLDPYFSFWGSPFRGDGFLNLGLCMVFGIFIFLILKAKDWQKIWNFSFIVGLLVALLAIFQKFRLFQGFLLGYSWRPVSTIGGPIFLALYLLLLLLLCFSFGIAFKGKKKFFYFLCCLVFLFVIILTGTRSALLGIGFAFLFFIFLWPFKTIYSKKAIWLKLAFGLILILGILGSTWFNSQPQLAQKLKENKISGTLFSRVWFDIKDFKGIISSRGSGWKVGFDGFKDRPILGYGPENFSIAFDRHYDPTLPGIIKGPGGAGSSSWWDKGHNFLLEVLVNTGILGLAAYLFLFLALFWQLQKLKRKELRKNEHRNTQKVLLAHGVQATFIGYFVANFFSFDVFSTYLILFLLIGYSFFLIRKAQTPFIQQGRHEYRKTPLWKYITISVLCLLLIIFVWNYNLKLFKINKEVNLASFLANDIKVAEYSDEAKTMTLNQKCGLALDLIKKTSSSHSILNTILRLQYIDIIGSCIEQMPERKLELTYKVAQLAEEVTELRPYYTRAWMFLAVYSHRIIRDDPDLTPETREQIIEKTYASFERAHQLSPKRQIIYIGWIKTDLVLENYEEAKKRVEECININPEYGSCWWAKALVYANAGNLEEAAKSIETADQKGYDFDSEGTLAQLIQLYGRLAKESDDLHYYEILADFYHRLIKLESIRGGPENFQHHASLAFIYKELGEYEKAREEAMIVLELSPESRANVEEFLKTLPAD